MRFRVLDIETVPDESVWTRGEPRWKMAPLKLDQEVFPRGFNGVQLVQEEPFPPPQANRVVAVAFVDVLVHVDSFPRYRFEKVRGLASWALDEADADKVERPILAWFAEYMCPNGKDDYLPTLVTWNGRGFDLPVLAMRSMKHGIPFGWYYKDRNMRYRFSEEGHLDLMDFLGDYGAGRNIKLGDFCRLVGLPGKLDVCGAQVADIVRGTRERPETLGGEQEKVRRYCMQDVVQTALGFLRTRHHLGKITAAEHDACAATFRDDADVRNVIPEICWEKFMLGGRS